MNAGAKNDWWRTYCGKNHTYVKAPVEGWKGVKNGVMRIGTERIPFRDWLQELKDEKWPGAWNSFWRDERFF
jgi:hypothetical protein